jgi:hypothetical protein
VRGGSGNVRKQCAVVVWRQCAAVACACSVRQWCVVVACGDSVR